MKRVVISQRVDVWEQRNETRDALDQRLASFIEACGALAFPVPNQMSESLLLQWLAVINPDAVVLSGGNDLGDSAARDGLEHQLLDYALEKRLPVLGICRGMQMMASWAGMACQEVEGHIGSRHCLQGELEAEVNSYHRLALCGCPRDFLILAQSEDQHIEAIRHRELPWEGWMWHPERENRFSKIDIDRCRALWS